MIEKKESDRFFDVFFTYVRILVDIPPKDQAISRQYFKPPLVKKDTLLESEGTIHKYHNFIVSGYMRNYHHDPEGREVTTDLNDGPRFFTSYNHFMQRTVSNENLHCLTDCEILRINREDVDLTAEISQTQKDYGLKVLQQQWEVKNQRSIDLTTLSAEQRYLKLMKNHPKILQNFPLKYIASFLGINPGSLSRIRSTHRFE